MTRRPARHSRTERSRELRNNKTKSESLLWSVLRSRQLGGLKFRRQHPIGPYFADFACLDRHAVVELDGEYHDYQYEMDRKRQAYMESIAPPPHPLPQIIRDKLKHIGSTTCANNSGEGEPECGRRKGAVRPGGASKPYVPKSAHPTTVILRTVLRRLYPRNQSTVTGNCL